MRGKDFPISIFRFLYPRVSLCRFMHSSLCHGTQFSNFELLTSYCIEVFTGQEFLSWKSDEEGTLEPSVGAGFEGGEHQHPAVLFTLICHQSSDGYFSFKNR